MGRLGRLTAFFLSLMMTCTAAMALTSPRVAAADDISAADTFEKLVPSLAIIVSGRGKSIGIGTGFCIYSDEHGSVFLTNKHVADTDDISVRVAQDDGVYSGRVLRRGTNSDVAVIAISRPNMSCVTLASAMPKAGTPIAVAGYPSIQLRFGNLKPSVHLGSVNALDGQFIQHDALTDHGNSGGPLFDRATGVVYGINTFGIDAKSDLKVVNYFAIAIPSILSVLDNARVSYKTDQRARDSTALSPNSVKEKPSAYRVAYLSSALQNASAADIKRNLDSHITGLLTALYGNLQVLPALMSSSPDAFARLCQEQQVNAVLVAFYDWNFASHGAMADYTSHVSLGLFDCSMNPVYVAKGEAHSTGRIQSYETNYENVSIAAADNAFAAMTSGLAPRVGAVDNLLRYGVPVGNGERYSGLFLTPGPSGAVLTVLARDSAAERAGLINSARISSINGVPVAGLQRPDLDTLIQQVERSGGKYTVHVTEANGHDRTITFQSETLQDVLRRKR
ncbi:MAG: hypothetical protein NVSMB64_18600 [Candidatus Velthaea sp.]